MKNIAVVVGLLIFLLQGCVAMGPKFSGYQQINEGNSVIYIFRQSKFDSKAYCPDILINNDIKFCMKDGGFARFEVKPGSHTITVKRSIMDSREDYSIQLNTAPQKRYFFEFVPNSTLEGVGTYSYSRYDENLFRRNESYSKPVLKTLNDSL